MNDNVYTQFGQYCCGKNPNNRCSGGGSCSSTATGTNFVFNMVNLFTQFDISWIGIFLY